MNQISGKLQTIAAKIAIVVSEFNSDITGELLNGASTTLQRYLNKDDITIVKVPGAVEIAFTAQRLARTKKFDAIITLGAIIYGETDHYHYVCKQVSDNCQRVMLDESIPVVFGVLTVQSKQLALARTGGKKGHMGVEAAEAAIKMLTIVEQI